MPKRQSVTILAPATPDQVVLPRSNPGQAQRLAMSEYQGARVDELLSDEPLTVEAESRQTGRFLRFGLSLGLVGCAGAALVYSQRPQKQFNVLDRVGLFSNGIISTFSRNLEDGAETTSATVDIEFEADGVEASWPMKIAVSSRTGEEHCHGVDAVITFNSKAGEAEELKEDLQGVVDGVVDFLKNMQGIDASPMFEINAGDDEAAVTFHLPLQKDEISEAENEDGGSKPKLRASLAFGRTLEEMLENKDESMAVVHGGLKFHAGIDVGRKVLELSAKQSGQSHDETEKQMKAVEVLASLESSNSIKYRKERLAAAVGMMNLGTWLQNFHGIPAGILDPLKKVHDHADGLKTVVVRGLPKKEELVFSFTNFKLSAVLGKVIDGLEPPPPWFNGDQPPIEDIAPAPAPDIQAAE